MKESQRMSKYVRKLENPQKPLVTKSEVKRLIKDALKSEAELKYSVTTTSALGGTSIPSVGIIQDFSNFAQGITDTTRVGDTVKYVNFEFDYDVIAADSTNVVRLVLVKYHPNDIPVVQSFFFNTLGNVNSPLATFSKDNRPKFDVLWEHTHHMTLTNNACEGKHFDLKIGGPAAQFVNTGTVGTEHIYLLALSDSSGLPFPTISFVGRINFTDS